MKNGRESATEKSRIDDESIRFFIDIDKWKKGVYDTPKG